MTDDRDEQGSEDPIEREEHLDVETIFDDAAELFEQPAESPADDSDTPPPG